MTNQRAAYAEAVNLAAHGFIAVGARPELQPLVRDAVIRAIALKGGMVGDRVRINVAGEVLAEVVQCGLRLFATEFAQCSKLPDAMVEQVEIELGTICARTLGMIRERFA